MRAALIYQHATTDRDAAIAVALSELAGQARSTSATESEPTTGPSSVPLSARGRARPGATGTRGFEAMITRRCRRRYATSHLP